MLDVKRVIASAPKKHDKGALQTLMTPWGEGIDPDQVLEEHPRPQFARERFQILNGYWECAIIAVADARGEWRDMPVPPAACFDRRILVPFTPGTHLSGVDHVVQPNELLWYRRTFATPSLGDGDRCVLHFEAVDYACACYVNGTRVGEHVGGYLPFSFDITDALGQGSAEAAEIVLCVFDPTDEGTQLRGKQQLESGGIWYTAQAGIWQTVWWEIVPARRVEALDIYADAEGVLVVTAQLSSCGEELRVTLTDAHGAPMLSQKMLIAESSEDARTTRTLMMKVEDVRLWDVDDPYLYGLEVCYGSDAVRSYCGFRTVSMEEDGRGVKRFCLNGRPLLLRGVLDQGYWSDGLMTAPSDEALVHDIVTARKVGFNMMRKHIKIECDRWYYHCDRLGMLVWQDAVSGGGRYDAWHTSYKPTVLRRSWHTWNDALPGRYGALSADDAAYRAEWERTCLGMIDHLRNHPSIVTWVLFNEGWGQFDARKMTSFARSADPTRPIDAVSGWYDQSCGDFHSVHNYFREIDVWRDPANPADARDCYNETGRRAFAISEFGGLSFAVLGHCAFEGSYGYETFDDVGAWRTGVRECLAQAVSLESRGLAGFVFTQLSDVEEEVNGIMTFDRRVCKLDDQRGLS